MFTAFRLQFKLKYGNTKPNVLEIVKLLLTKKHVGPVSEFAIIFCTFLL